ncbi:MAG: cell envelope integrity protein TolA [Rhizobiaceae bacterium]|nr:cell envelope integrity protein TolA [Rhizobiaceae bacterium]
MAQQLVASPLAADIFVTDAKYRIDATAKALVITLPGGDEESYSITSISGPSATASLVIAAQEDVLHDMSLSQLGHDLDRSVDLMYVAYCGVGGTGEVEASVNDRQIELLNACGDCLVTMGEFESHSGEIIGRLTEGFDNLLQAKEERALKVLSHCKDVAQKMADASATLSQTFKDLGDKSQQAAHLTIVAKGMEKTKLDELRKQTADMKSLLAAQKKLNDQLQIDQQATDRLYQDARHQEDVESERQMIGQIVGGLTSAIGAGVAAYGHAQSQQPPATTQASSAPAANPPVEAVPQDKAKQTAANKAAADVAEQQATVEQAETKVDAEDKRIQTLTQEKEDAVANAEDDKVTALLAQVETAEQNKKDAQDEAKAAKADLEKAKQALADAQAALAGVGAAATEMGKTANAIAQNAKDAAESAHQLSMQLLNHKFDLEKKKLDALSQVAELTERLKYAHAEKTIDQAALDSLQISVWAFAQISATFSTLKTFWDSMQKHCEDLRGLRVIERIKEEQEDKDETRQDRITYYSTDDRFFFSAVLLLVRWRAMQEISRKYVDVVTTTRSKCDRNIRSAPTIEQAKKQLPQLQAEIAHKLKLEALNSDKRSKKIEAAIKLLAERNE